MKKQINFFWSFYDVVVLIVSSIFEFSVMFVTVSSLECVASSTFRSLDRIVSPDESVLQITETSLSSTHCTNEEFSVVYCSE